MAADWMPYRLALIPTARAADSPLAIGWQGALEDSRMDAGVVPAALRSWEERFLAAPVFLRMGGINLGAQRPPQSDLDAASLAAELIALAGNADYEEMEEYMHTLAKARSGQWNLWWGGA
jgi:hypothetical protein